MINKVILVGNVGRDPELRYTQSGTAVANFSLATNRRRKVNEQWEDETEWHRLVAWGRTAEVVNQYGGKGKQLYVEGRLQTRDWEDRDGNKRYTTEVVVEELKLLGGRVEGGGDFERGGGPDDRSDEAQASGGNRPSGGDGGGGGGGGGGMNSPVTDDDIPF